MIIDSKTEINYFYKIFEKEGYKFNEQNPFGIRNFNKIKDGVYNDVIGLLSEKQIFFCKATTDPSPWYIEKYPMNAEGTAVILEGMQNNIWMVGTHAKRVIALINGWNGIHHTEKQKVKRLDKKYNFRDKIYTGWFCCNLHPAFDTRNYIGKNSAGCQVIANMQDFKKFMNFILESNEYKNNKWTLYSYYIFIQNSILLDLMKEL